MFNSKTKPEPTDLDKAITKVHERIEASNPGSDEYTTLINQLDELTKLSSRKKERLISPDTLAIIGGNLLGIVLILGYEHAHVLTSKAVGFVTKPKL